MAADTQAYLDEAKSHNATSDATPLVADTVNGQTAVCTIPYLRQGVRAWRERVGRALEEMSRQERMLMDSIDTEADDGLKAQLVQQLSNVRTVLRLGKELQDKASDFNTTYRQYMDQDATLRTAAETVGGYTI